MSEVRLTQSERQALVAAEHMTQSGCACEPIRDVVEAIVAGRLAAVEALADEFDSNIDWSAGRNNYGDNEAWESAARQLRAALTAVPDSEDRQAGRALRGPGSGSAGLGGRG